PARRCQREAVDVHLPRLVDRLAHRRAYREREALVAHRPHVERVAGDPTAVEATPLDEQRVRPRHPQRHRPHVRPPAAEIPLQHTPPSPPRATPPPPPPPPPRPPVKPKPPRPPAPAVNRYTSVSFAGSSVPLTAVPGVIGMAATSRSSRRKLYAPVVSPTPN